MLRAIAVFFLALILLSCNTYRRADPPQSAVRHQPRTLWDACFSEQGKLLLPSDTPPHTPKCKNPSPIFWKRGQVRIGVYQSSVEGDRHLDAAIAQWNAWLGWEMFVRSSLAWDVVVIYSDPNPFIMGLAHLEIEHGVLIGAFAIYGYSPSRCQHTMLHELGHILGLAHDVDGRGGLMAPGGKDDDSMVRYEDLLALRRLYGRL